MTFVRACPLLADRHSGVDLCRGKSKSHVVRNLLNTFEQSYSETYANAVIVGFHAESADPRVTSAACVVGLLQDG